MLTLHVTALSHSGDGIAHHDGRTVFIPGALPGETIEAEITQTKKDVARARLVSVTTPAPQRVPAPCPVFERCGGCQLQHLGYADQLRFKEDQVRVQLRRLAGQAEAPVRAILPAPEAFGYRNQIQWSLTAEGALRTCLFALEEHDLRGPLRAGADDDELAARIQAAVATKWAGHRIGQPVFVRPGRSMSQIGG